MVMLQLRGASGASDRVASSVQRVIAAAVAEPVEAVRPPGGHQRVGSRTNCVRSVTEIRLTDMTDHQIEHIHVPVKQRDKLFKGGIFVPDGFDPLQNINLSLTPGSSLFPAGGILAAHYCRLQVSRRSSGYGSCGLNHWLYYTCLSFSFLLHEHFKQNFYYKNVCLWTKKIYSKIPIKSDSTFLKSHEKWTKCYNTILHVLRD